MKCLNCNKEISKGKYCMDKPCRYKYLSEYIRKRYKNDLEFRQKMNEYSKKYRKERYIKDPKYRENSIKRLREYYFKKCLELAKNNKINELKKYMKIN